MSRLEGKELDVPCSSPPRLEPRVPNKQQRRVKLFSRASCSCAPATVSKYGSEWTDESSKSISRYRNYMKIKMLD